MNLKASPPKDFTNSVKGKKIKKHNLSRQQLLEAPQWQRTHNVSSVSAEMQPFIKDVNLRVFESACEWDFSHCLKSQLKF